MKKSPSATIPQIAFSTTEISSPFGLWWIVFCPQGIKSLQQTRPSSLPSDALPSAWQQEIFQTLHQNIPVLHTPLLPDGTPFQKKIWAALRQIPVGETVSYSELAEIIGHPKAARAVGSACAANPIPFLIPCHRVICANGNIGQFLFGATMKRALLCSEKQNLSTNPQPRVA